MIPGVTGLAQSIDWLYVLEIALFVAAAVCILGGVLRLIFGKGSSMVRSVSACVSLVLIYLTGIVLYVLVPQIRGSLASLPFISVTADAFSLWNIAGMDAASLYAPTLQLFVLAFIVNLLESLLPRGKKLLSWYGFRLLTVAAALAVYTLVCTLINSFVPQLFGEWAGFVLLGIWIFIGLIGLLKLLLTVVLAVINPIIGALYAFFFSNLFGKQFTKSILTTVLCVVLLVLLYRLGFVAFAFDSFSLAAYGPSCLIALLALYLFGKLL